MYIKVRGQLEKLDEEWVVLIKKARKIGFTLDELRKFLELRPDEDN